MNSDFSVGSVVRLKSGSLPMTIAAEATEYGMHVVVCVWFDAQNTPQERTFNHVVLRKYEYES